MQIAQCRLLLATLLLLCSTFCAASAGMPPQWNWTRFQLEQVAGITSQSAVTQLASCLKRNGICKQRRTGALLILVTRKNTKKAALYARRVLALGVQDSWLTDTALQTLAVAGDAQLLRNRMELPGTIVEAWALARGGDYSFSGQLLSYLSSLQSQMICAATGYVDPFLESASPSRNEMLSQLLQALSVTHDQTQHCVEKAIERNWHVLREREFVLVRAHLLTLLESTQSAGHRRGAKLAKLWLPRLSDNQALASALVRAAVSAADGDIWADYNDAAIGLGLLAFAVKMQDQQREVRSTVFVTSGTERVSLSEFLQRHTFSTRWKRYANELTELQLLEFLDSLKSQEQNAVDLPKKLMYLRNAKILSASMYGRISLATLLFEQHLDNAKGYVKQLSAELVDAQKISLATRLQAVSPGLFNDVPWQAELAQTDPWLKFAVLFNLGDRCGLQAAIGETALAKRENMVLLNQKIESKVFACMKGGNAL